MQIENKGLQLKMWMMDSRAGEHTPALHFSFCVSKVVFIWPASFSHEIILQG